MVLEDVAQGPGILVVLATPLDADVLRHGDLHVVDVTPIPDGFEDAIGKTEHEDVLHRLLSQVVVDAVDLLLGEHRVDRLVESLGALQVVPERLFDHDPLPALARLGDPGSPQPVDDDGEELGGGRQVKDAVAVGPSLAIEPVELGGQPAVPGSVVERHPHIGDPLGKALPDGPIDRLASRILLHRLLHVGAELILSEGRVGDADHAEARRKVAVEGQVIERRHQFARGQVPGGAEDNHRRRVGRAGQDQPVAQDILGQRYGRGLGHALFRPDGVSPKLIAQCRENLRAE